MNAARALLLAAAGPRGWVAAPLACTRSEAESALPFAASVAAAVLRRSKA